MTLAVSISHSGAAPTARGGGLGTAGLAVAIATEVLVVVVMPPAAPAEVVVVAVVMLQLPHCCGGIVLGMVILEWEVMLS